MRNLIVSIVFSLVSLSIIAQGCLPEGIEFTTQTQIDSFAINHPNCTEIEGDVYIGEWDDDGSDITNLNGLSVLTSIDGSLIIGSAAPMAVLSNPLLTSLEGLTNLSYIGGNLTLIANTSLGSLAGLESLTSIEGLLIAGNDSLTSLTGLDNISYIEGDLVIGSQFGSAMGSYILGNPSLASLTGLEGLSSIGGNLRIGKNDTLTSLTGLEGLTSIGGNLEIGFETGDISYSGNPSLASLTGLENLTSIGGNFDINSNSSLTSLTGLENLTSIGGDMGIIDNDALTSLMGLDNIESNSIEDLIIYGNGYLYTCEVQSICDYLASPNGTVNIHDNAPGCDSQEEVEEACASSISEVGALIGLTSSPNPFTTSTTLSYELKEPSTVQLSVFNQLGQLVYHHSEEQQQGEQQLQWDASKHADGLYFYRLNAEDQVATGKLVKAPM